MTMNLQQNDDHGSHSRSGEQKEPIPVFLGGPHDAGMR